VTLTNDWPDASIKKSKFWPPREEYPGPQQDGTGRDKKLHLGAALCAGAKTQYARLPVNTGGHALSLTVGCQIRRSSVLDRWRILSNAPLQLTGSGGDRGLHVFASRGDISPNRGSVLR
jgi:hypothetical protein